VLKPSKKGAYAKEGRAHFWVAAQPGAVIVAIRDMVWRWLRLEPSGNASFTGCGQSEVT
jgi:hypothetical protein